MVDSGVHGDEGGENISVVLSEGVLALIDAGLAHGETRSSFIAKAIKAALAESRETDVPRLANAFVAATPLGGVECRVTVSGGRPGQKIDRHVLDGPESALQWLLSYSDERGLDGVIVSGFLPGDPLSRHAEERVPYRATRSYVRLDGKLLPCEELPFGADVACLNPTEWPERIPNSATREALEEAARMRAARAT